MRKLTIYIKGILIGMITEYVLRVEFGYMQGFILTVLITSMIKDVIANWRRE